MAEEQKDKAAREEKEEQEKDEKAWERKVEDKTGRDWSKPKTFKPSGKV